MKTLKLTVILTATDVSASLIFLKTIYDNGQENSTNTYYATCILLYLRSFTRQFIFQINCENVTMSFTVVFPLPQKQKRLVTFN